MPGLGVKVFHLERMKKKKKPNPVFQKNEPKTDATDQDDAAKMAASTNKSANTTFMWQDVVAEPERSLNHAENTNKFDNKDNNSVHADIDGYMINKVYNTDKQFNKDAATVQKTSIFDGIEVYVNGQTHPPKERIREWMAIHGGHHSDWHRNTTTHYVADVLAATKIEPALKLRRNGCKIVTARWVEDSIQAGRLLPEGNYQLDCLIDHQQPSIMQLMTTSSNHSSTTSSTSSNSTSAPSRSPSSKSKQSSSSSSSSSSSPTTTSTLTSSTTSNQQIIQRGARSSKNDPNFIHTFFHHSRLHFIGSFRAHLRRLVRTLRPRPPTQISSKHPSPRVIVHIDMDCFFVSVSLRTRPELIGKPVAISWGGNGNDSNGEISSASYEARKFGVNAGMWLKQARTLCSDLQVVPYEFDKYQTVSEQVYRLLFELTSYIEVCSCDEAFIDLTNYLLQDMRSPETIISELRQKIYTTTGCTASAGIGRNKMLAKMATDYSKKTNGPNTQHSLLSGSNVLSSTSSSSSSSSSSTSTSSSSSSSSSSISSTNEKDIVAAFMSTRKLRDIPGIGRQTSLKLNACVPPIESVTDLLNLDLRGFNRLKNTLGSKSADSLKKKAQGIDDLALKFESTPSTISAQITWGVRFDTEPQVIQFLTEMCQELSDRLVRNEYVGRRIILKESSKFLGHGKCDDFSNSSSFNTRTCDPKQLATAVIKLWKQKPCHMDPTLLRGVGLDMNDLLYNDTNGQQQSNLQHFWNDKNKNNVQHNSSSSSSSNNSNNTNNSSSSNNSNNSNNSSSSSSSSSSSNSRSDFDGSSRSTSFGNSQNDALIAVLPADIGLEFRNNPDAMFRAQHYSIKKNNNHHNRNKNKRKRYVAKVPSFNEQIPQPIEAEAHLKLKKQKRTNGLENSKNYFSNAPWSKETRSLFVSFMSTVESVEPLHIEFVLQYLFDLLQQKRMSEIILILRCIRSTSCYHEKCFSWKYPFYILLETIQEGIRSGCCVAGGNVAVLCTASFVPKLSVEEKNEALNGVGSLK